MRHSGRSLTDLILTPGSSLEIACFQTILVQNCAPGHKNSSPGLSENFLEMENVLTFNELLCQHGGIDIAYPYLHQILPIKPNPE